MFNMERNDSMKNFLSELSKLERQILVNGGNTYNQNTRRVLLKLIRYVEKANFTKSIHTKFICENFRLNPKQWQHRWNQLHNENKTEATFRSQASTISLQLFSIFGSDFPSIFLAEDEQGLYVIDGLIEALSACPDNIGDYFTSDMLEHIKDVEWEKSYTTEELIPVINAIRPFTKNHISDVVRGLDKQKLSYLFHILKQPLTSNRTRKTNLQKVEILSRLRKGNSNQGNVQDNGFIDRLRMAGKANNNFADSKENRDYLRNMIKYYSNQGLNEALRRRKISSNDIKRVLYELESSSNKGV